MRPHIIQSQSEGILSMRCSLRRPITFGSCDPFTGLNYTLNERQNKVDLRAFPVRPFLSYNDMQNSTLWINPISYCWYNYVEQFIQRRLDDCQQPQNTSRFKHFTRNYCVTSNLRRIILRTEN